MKYSKIFLCLVLSICIVTSCKKQLDVKNPNNPTPESAATETGVIALAQGGVYVNGFRDLKYSDGVFGLFWSGAVGFHEMMGDVIGAEAANAYINQIGAPDKVVLDNGTIVLNPNAPNTQYAALRSINDNSNLGNNPLYYEWGYMYNLIVASNNVLDVAARTSFTGDSSAKRGVINAWAYFWKGFAYARIGSIYYAGIINNALTSTNADYVTKEQIITESNSNFDKAYTILSGLTFSDDYQSVVGRLIPDFNQVGRGGILSPDEWKRNINTMKARNILVNTPAALMTTAQWNDILTLANDGVQLNDLIFTGRSNTNGDFLDASGGTVASKTESTEAGGNTYKLSERWVQDFKTGDKRLANNVMLTTTWIGNSDRGNSFNTRYTLVNGGSGLAGVWVYANTTAGEEELVLAGSYEENALMIAEAKINTGGIDGGLTSIDDVRDFMGAGLAPVSGTGLALALAKEELRRERRIALAYRGLSFYDARRWGVINPLSDGGGRTGAVVIDGAGNVNTNTTIEYRFLDYWDVPDNELAYNPPNAGSAPVVNPKQ